MANEFITYGYFWEVINGLKIWILSLFSDSVYKTITYADLLAGVNASTISDGNYNVTNCPITEEPLKVTVYKGQVQPSATIQRTFFSRGSVQVDDPHSGASGVSKLQLDGSDIGGEFSWNGATYGCQVVDVGGAISGTTATGLANDTTVFEANVDVDGNANPIAITGSAAQTYTALVSQLNADTTGATWSIENGNLICRSNTTGVTSTIVITDTDLFISLTDFDGFGSPVNGLDAMTQNEIANLMLSSLTSLNGFVSGNTFYLNNDSITNGGVLSIANVSGDNLNYSSNNLSGGGIIDLRANYDFLQDYVVTEEGARNNIVASSNWDSVNAFPFNNTNVYDNDLRTLYSTDFATFAGALQGLKVNNYCRMNVSGSNTSVLNTQLSNEVLLDVSALIESETVDGWVLSDNISIYFDADTITKNPVGGVINKTVSTLQKDFTITTNTISGNQTLAHNWAGVQNIPTAGQIKTVTNLNVLPQNNKLVCTDASNPVTIEWTDTTNIIVTAETKALWQLLNALSTTITLNENDNMIWENDGENMIITKINTF